MPQPDENSEPKIPWLRQHQATIREWLVLIAAVIAGLAGWQQIADERNVRKESEARAQADLISAWSAERRRGERMSMVLSNASHQPVYQVVVFRKPTAASGKLWPNVRNPEIHAIWVLPPGKYRVKFKNRANPTSAITVAFRDQAGRNWIRRSNGLLEQISDSPSSAFNLEWPIPWRLPEKIG
jgi:hypothetical protein